MIVQIVRFTSQLSEQEVIETYGARAPQYRALEGLVQKYYLRFPATGEHGAVYVWKSEAAMQAFRASPLAAGIADAYQVVGGPDVVTADVVHLLRSAETRS